MALTKEEIYEAELTRNYNLGIGIGWEHAADFLLTGAIQKFKENKIDEAAMLRKLSIELQEIGQEKTEKARNN